jgi:hypothetical protein
MAKARKAMCEMVVPGEIGWERWQAPEGQAGKCVESSGDAVAEMVYSKGPWKRLLVLPVAHVWVMPAWLKGDAALIQDMALLHLERLGVRVDEPERALSLIEVTVKEEARLLTMLALKDQPTPLAVASLPPDEVRVSAAHLPLPASSITVWRELGRLVFGITSGDKLVYASPLTAGRFDERAIGELNNACLQLGFQRVLGRVEELVLWLDEGEGDLQAIERTTGLPVRREARPNWTAPTHYGAALMPLDLHLARQMQDVRSRQRVIALSAGLVISAVAALMMVMITMALREQTQLREQVAELTPRAARVLDQKRSWQEAAPAVDPSQGPMQFLLGLQEPTVAADVTLMHLEFTPKKVIVRGHTSDAAKALQYSQAIQEGEMLLAYDWEAPPPELAVDESATFELKGGRP